MVHTLCDSDGDSWPEAGGHRRGSCNSSQRGRALGSGPHSAPFAAAQKASWAGIPDPLLMSGKAFVGASVETDTAGQSSNSAALCDRAHAKPWE